MQTALITLGVSLGVLLLLVLLFTKEERRGSRFAEALRKHVDTGVLALYAFCSYITQPFRRDTMRHSLHYFFHRALKRTKQALRSVESRVDVLLRTNKALAKKVSTESSSRLQEIAAHKKESALSPAEKKKQKEQAIGTRL